MTDPHDDPKPAGTGAARDPPGDLLDDLQRRMRPDLPERVGVDVSLPVHAGCPVLLQETQSKEPVDRGPADALLGSSLVDRQQIGQVVHIVTIRVTPPPHRCND